MNKLFNTPDKSAEETPLLKLAYQQVSSNPSDWTKDAMEAFYSQYPEFGRTPVKIEWKQRDEQKGYAVGVIHVQDKSGIAIPIVIKDWDLYPYDVAYIGNNVMPLTSTTFKMYMQSKGAFLKVVPKETGDITELLFNPSFSQTLQPNYTNMYTKEASVIEKIAETVPNEARTEFFSTLPEGIKEELKKNGTAAPIMKLASIPYKKANYEETLHRKLPRDIQYVYQNDEGDYKVKLGNSRISDTVEIELDETAAKSLDQVKTAMVYDLPGAASTESRLVYHDKYLYAPKEIEAKIHDFGVYTVGQQRTAPLTIMKKWFDGDVEHCDCHDGLNAKHLQFMSGLDSIEESDNGVTYLPKHAKFIKLTLVKKASEEVDPRISFTNWVTKTASDRYTFGGAEFEQYLPTGDRVDQDVHATKWAMIQCGSSIEDLNKVAQLNIGERYHIPRKLHVPAPLSKVAQLFNKDASRAAHAIQRVAQDMFKEAAQMPSLPTVDAVLSLNFITKDNIQQFVDALPTFENVVHLLAKMLITVRIGDEIAPEHIVRKTMHNLIDIISVLRGLTAIAKKGKE